jgi:ribosomal protein S18 acetylase RimI-like enzyme
VLHVRGLDPNRPIKFSVDHETYLFGISVDHETHLFWKAVLPASRPRPSGSMCLAGRNRAESTKLG